MLRGDTYPQFRASETGDPSWWHKNPSIHEFFVPSTFLWDIALLEHTRPDNIET